MMSKKQMYSDDYLIIKQKTNNTMRPYVQEIIDLTKQVDDLTSDNVDLKEQLKEFNKHMIIRDRQKDILWEYISEKDVDKISARFNKL